MKKNYIKALANIFDISQENAFQTMSERDKSLLLSKSITQIKQRMQKLKGMKLTMILIIKIIAFIFITFTIVGYDEVREKTDGVTQKETSENTLSKTKPTVTHDPDTIVTSETEKARSKYSIELLSK